MAPRPDVLEEPHFQLPNLGLTTQWQKKIGLGDLDPRDFSTRFFRGDYKEGDLDFLFSTHDISVDGPWVPQKVIGSGSFGTAGLWKKSNLEGDTIDEIVIKELKQFDNGGGREVDYKIKREASINRDAQRQARALLTAGGNKTDSLHLKEHSILHLRDYKYNRSCETSRFYSIYAPHRDLADLICRYRSWDIPLPELFLWHLACSLAKAAKALSIPPHPSSLVHQDPDHLGGYSQKCSILHRDIKPENIFLDYAPLSDEQINAVYNQAPNRDVKHGPIDTYPTIRLADFGLSVYAGPNNKGVDSFLHRVGTRGTWPPEQTEWGSWFTPGQRPVNPKAPWTAKHNIWCIGKLIHDCMTLDHWHCIDEAMHLETRSFTQEEYVTNRRHFLPKAWSHCVQHVAAYDRSLFDLVRDCLSPRPEDRPAPDELVVKTLQGLRDTCEKMGSSTKPGDASQYRLYYRRREIEELRSGPYWFPTNEADWNGAKRCDDSGVSLKLPEPKWKLWNDARRAKPAPDPIKEQVAVQREYQRYQADRRKLRDRNEKLVKKQQELDRIAEKKRVAQSTKKQSNLASKPPATSKNKQGQAVLATGPRPVPVLEPKAAQQAKLAPKPTQGGRGLRRGVIASSALQFPLSNDVQQRTPRPTKADMDREWDNGNKSPPKRLDQLSPNNRSPQRDRPPQHATRKPNVRFATTMNGTWSPNQRRSKQQADPYPLQNQRRKNEHLQKGAAVKPLAGQAPLNGHQMVPSPSGTVIAENDARNGQQQNVGELGATPGPTGAIEISSDEENELIHPPHQRKVPAKTNTKGPKPFQTQSAHPQKPAPRDQRPSGEYRPQLQHPQDPQQRPAQQTPAVQGPVQNNPPPQATPGLTQPQQHQCPNSAQYMRMTIAEMRDELNHRGVAVPANADGRRVLKVEYKRKLRDADTSGTHGRGAYKKRK